MIETTNASARESDGGLGACLTKATCRELYEV